MDYRNSPTKNVKLNLSIIGEIDGFSIVCSQQNNDSIQFSVPPHEPVIRNQNGMELMDYETKPYEVGQTLTLDCDVSGGNPLPKVTWWQGGSMFDSTDEVTRMGNIVNHMVYKSLTRDDLFKVFVCQASNTNKTLPVSKKVKVVINRKDLIIMPCWIKN